MNNKLTCKGCENRYSGCHSTCKEYLAWKREHDAELKKVNSNKLAERIANDRFGK